MSAGKDQFQIEGYLATGTEPGRQAALLVLYPGPGKATRCIEAEQHLTELGLRVACISIPGYGASSGPSRYMGQQAVAAARRALDLLAQRSDVDPSRMAVWGNANSAVVAGLVMDADPRPRAVVLESGDYDLLRSWRHAPLLTKLSILHQVWPSRSNLQKRSVMEHLPPRLQCSVLILHGEHDQRSPVGQARNLERALRERGAKVETYYFPGGKHQLGPLVREPVKEFLRNNLAAQTADHVPRS